MKLIKDFLNLLRGEPNLKKLKKNGLTVGENFYYGTRCFFDPSHTFLISIGNNVTFSTRVHILAHDASTKKINGYTKILPVKIEDNVFVGANVTILPGVTIGNNSIIGAGSVVTKNIPSNVVAAGNPCNVITTLDVYKEKYNSKNNVVFFDESYTVRNRITREKKEEMKEKLKDKIGFVK